MEKYILDAYMDKANLPTGTLAIKYDFTTGYTGIGNNDFIIFNEVYSTGVQYYDSPTQKIISTYSPAITLIDTPHYITGDGLFEGSGILKITNEIKDDAWTAFFQIKPSLVNKDRTKGQVLLSTIESGAADISGFRFGINGANKLFLEHPNSLSHEDLRVSTLTDHRLGVENIISISYDGNLAEISSHNFDSDKTERDYVDLSGYNQSAQWYIGNNVSVPNKNVDPVYTGYSGYINDFIYFNEYLTIDQKDTIAESFFVESYVAETTGEITGLFNLVTGTEISGIFLESGITGYELRAKDDTTQLGGGIVQTYYLSGVSGDISGDVITELTGSATGAFSEIVTIAEQIDYDEELIARVNKEYSAFIVLNRSNVDADDDVEIYSRPVQSENVDLRPSYMGNVGVGNVGVGNVGVGDPKFELDSEYISGDFVNLYHNGILQTPPSVDLFTGDRIPVQIEDPNNPGDLYIEMYELDYGVIKSGQKYYFDNSKDLAKHDILGPRAKLYTGTKDWVVENRGEGVSEGYVTASRDGFIFGHYHTYGAWSASDYPKGRLDIIDSTLKLDIGTSGSYEIIDNNKIRNEEGHSFEKNDFLLYDKVTENHNYYVFTGAGMDASTSITIDNKNIKDVIVLSGDAYVNSNIFVNGIKMISGTFDELENSEMEVEYTWGDHNVNGVTAGVSIISTSGFSDYTLGAGNLLSDLAEKNELSLLQFVPHVTENFVRFTGAGRVDYEIGLMSASEQLWFNGQRGIPPKSEFSDLTVLDAAVSYIKVNKDGLGSVIPQTYIDFTTNTSSLNDVHQSHPFLTRVFDQEFSFGFDVNVPPTGRKYFAITPV
jgi:hypothetical protein